MGAAMRRADLPDHAREVRQRLIEPRTVCAALGLLDGYRPGRQAGGGVTIRCPKHRERTPSCSVSTGRDGTLRVHCFSGCGLDGDVFVLVAAALGLDARRDFAAVLGHAAGLAGVDLASTAPLPVPVPRPVAPVPAPPSYPPRDEVHALWAACVPVEADDAVSAYLDGERRIAPAVVDLYDCARALPVGARVPAWARCGRPWPLSGHRLIVPVYDAAGELRSLRAWCIESGAVAKRVAPSGFSTVGLVMADQPARSMLATGGPPAWFDDASQLTVVICEGEPDWLTWATWASDADELPPAVLGVVSAAWSESIAARVPSGCRVAIRTHLDAAGKRYAADIARTLADRCEVHELESDDDADDDADESEAP
jgi:hypothetical protein